VIGRLVEGARVEEMKRGFVEIFAQTAKWPLGEHELGVALSVAF
jgi:hypothetical protein